MTALRPELRQLIEAGPVVHLSTVNADGSPQVSAIWVALDGDDLLSGHLGWRAKLRNIDRDPRVVLSFDAPGQPGEFLRPYAVLRARAELENTPAAWDLLDRLAKVYIGPGEPFPAPRPEPGHDAFIVRYRIDRVTGVGPWAG